MCPRRANGQTKDLLRPPWGLEIIRQLLPMRSQAALLQATCPLRGAGRITLRRCHLPLGLQALGALVDLHALRCARQLHGGGPGCAPPPTGWLISRRVLGGCNCPGDRPGGHPSAVCRVDHACKVCKRDPPCKRQMDTREAPLPSLCPLRFLPLEPARREQGKESNNAHKQHFTIHVAARPRSSWLLCVLRLQAPANGNPHN